VNGYDGEAEASAASAALARLWRVLLAIHVSLALITLCLAAKRAFEGRWGWVAWNVMFAVLWAGFASMEARRVKELAS
jgi:hypothetical protein